MNGVVNDTNKLDNKKFNLSPRNVLTNDGKH